MSAAYPDFSWFIRAVRLLPVVAGAALAGGVIGGASIFAIDSALTSAPQHDLHAADATKPVASAAASPQANADTPQNAPSSIRTVDTSAASSSPVPVTAAPTVPSAQPAQPQPQTQVQAPQAAPAAPASQKTWPDALSHAHPPATGAADSATAPAPVASAPAAPPEQNLVGARAVQPATRDRRGTAAAAAKERPLYDYYGRDYDRTRRVRDDQDAQPGSDKASLSPAEARQPHTDNGGKYAKPRVVVRRQKPDDTDRSDDTDAATPERHEFFWGGGFFGRDDRYNNERD